MAQQELLNGETRGSFRTKLNTILSELYGYFSSVSTSITNLNNSVTTLNTTTTDLDTRLDTAETSITGNTSAITDLQEVGATSVTCSSSLTPVSLTTTYSKLTYFNSIALQASTYTTASIPAQTVTVGANGVYKVYGAIVAEFPTTTEVSIRLYKNGVAITPAFSQQGLGAGHPTNLCYTTMLSLSAGDVLELYIVATSSITLTITGSSVNFEKTIF